MKVWEIEGMPCSKGLQAGITPRSQWYGLGLDVHYLGNHQQIRVIFFRVISIIKKYWKIKMKDDFKSNFKYTETEHDAFLALMLDSGSRIQDTHPEF